MNADIQQSVKSETIVELFPLNPILEDTSSNYKKTTKECRSISKRRYLKTFFWSFLLSDILLISTTMISLINQIPPPQSPPIPPLSLQIPPFSPEPRKEENVIGIACSIYKFIMKEICKVLIGLIFM